MKGYRKVLNIWVYIVENKIWSNLRNNFAKRNLKNPLKMKKWEKLLKEDWIETRKLELLSNNKIKAL